MPTIRHLQAKSRRLWRQFCNNEILLAVTVVVAVLCLGIFWGWYNNRTVPVNSEQLVHYNSEPYNPLSFLSNWDGPIYLHIAQHGYTDEAEANFFPLYPLSVSIAHHLVPSLLDSGLLVAWVSFVGATYFYLKIVKRLFGVRENLEAARGLLPFIFFPTAVFLIATYTESLFAFLALGSIYFALEKKFLPSALFAMACTATHVNGVAVLLLSTLLLVEARVRFTKVVLTVVIGNLGLASYMYSLAARYHQPFLFVKTQTFHGWFKGSYTHLPSTVGLFNAIFVVGLILSVIYWWPRHRSFAMYSLTFLCIPLIGRQFGGFNRYVLMAFPMQLMLYGWLRGHKQLYPLVTILLSTTWLYFVLQYAGGYIGG